MALTQVPQGMMAPNVAGNGPAFSAYASTNTALTGGVAGLIAYATEAVDTGNCYNNTGSAVTLNGLSVPAYSFCPNVAGYYQITGAWTTSSTAAQVMYADIFKNGSSALTGAFVQTSGTGGVCTVTGLVYLNGTGDYVQIYCTDTITVNTTQGNHYTYFQGAMARAA